MGNSDNKILTEKIEQKYSKWTMSDHEFRQFDFGYNTSLYDSPRLLMVDSLMLTSVIGTLAFNEPLL